MTARHRIALVHDTESVAPDRVPAPKADQDFGFIPRGLRRPRAAFYLGVSPTKFDDWVTRGLMPEPKEEGGVVVWDRRALDDAFDALPDRAARPKKNPFED